MKKVTYTRALNKAKATGKTVSVWSKGILFKVFPTGKVVSFY
jgi:hypothetical protein